MAQTSDYYIKNIILRDAVEPRKGEIDYGYEGKY
jgi:hypothetical protein